MKRFILALAVCLMAATSFAATCPEAEYVTSDADWVTGVAVINDSGNASFVEVDFFDFDTGELVSQDYFTLPRTSGKAFVVPNGRFVVKACGAVLKVVGPVQRLPGW